MYFVSLLSLFLDAEDMASFTEADLLQVVAYRIELDYVSSVSHIANIDPFVVVGTRNAAAANGYRDRIGRNCQAVRAGRIVSWKRELFRLACGDVPKAEFPLTVGHRQPVARKQRGLRGRAGSDRQRLWQLPRGRVVNTCFLRQQLNQVLFIR